MNETGGQSVIIQQISDHPLQPSDLIKGNGQKFIRIRVLNHLFFHGMYESLYGGDRCFQLMR
ncbi:hypothetical protein D3C78_1173840 [compost metagenome]